MPPNSLASIAVHSNSRTMTRPLRDQSELLLHALYRGEHGIVPLCHRLVAISVYDAPTRGDDRAVAVFVERGFGHFRGGALGAVAREEKDRIGNLREEGTEGVRLCRPDKR